MSQLRFLYKSFAILVPGTVLLAVAPLYALRQTGLEESPPTRRQMINALTAGVEESMSFRELVQRILDREEARGRQSKDWERLHERFVEFLEQDQKRGLVIKDEGDERKAREIMLKNNPKVTVKGLRESLASYRQKRVLPAALRKSLGIKGTFTFRPEVALIEMAAQTARVLEGLGTTRQLGPILQGAEPDGRLSPEEYLTRFREWLLYENQQQRYLALPAWDRVGFLTQEEASRLGEQTPFAILPLLAARQIGLEPTLRSSDLGKAILESGVREVEILEPTPGSVPALLVHLVKPLVDAASGLKFQTLAVAVLQEPLPGLPGIMTVKMLEEMSEEEFLQACLRSLTQEMASVETKVAHLREYAFQDNDPWSEKVEKLRHLFDLSQEGKLLPRSGYQPYSKESARHLSRWLGRTAQEVKAIQRHLEVVIETASRVEASAQVTWARTPETSSERGALADRFQRWKERVELLDQLGIPEMAQDPEAAGRVEQMIRRLSVRGEPFSVSEWERYRPLLRLLFARQEGLVVPLPLAAATKQEGGVVSLPPAKATQQAKDHWVLDDQEATYLINRIEKSRQALQESHEAVADAVRSAQGPLERAILLAELNQAALGILIQKRLRSPTDAIRRALLRVTEQIYHADLRQSPTALALQGEEREAILKSGRLVQAQLFENFPTNVSEMESALAQLEETGRRLKELGIPSSQEADPLRLDLFRSVVPLVRLVTQGQVLEAFRRSSSLLPLLEEKERSPFGSFRRSLAQRIAEETLEEVKTVPAEQREAANQHLRQAAQLLKAEYPDLAAKLITPRQQNALEFYSEFRNELEQNGNRLLKEFVEAVAQGQPFAEAKYDKLKGRYENLQRGRGGFPPVYLRVAEKFDSSLLLRKPSRAGPRAGLEELKERVLEERTPDGLKPWLEKMIRVWRMKGVTRISVRHAHRIDVGKGGGFFEGSDWFVDPKRDPLILAREIHDFLSDEPEAIYQVVWTPHPHFEQDGFSVKPIILIRPVGVGPAVRLMNVEELSGANEAAYKNGALGMDEKKWRSLKGKPPANMAGLVAAVRGNRTTGLGSLLFLVFPDEIYFLGFDFRVRSDHDRPGLGRALVSELSFRYPGVPLIMFVRERDKEMQTFLKDALGFLAKPSVDELGNPRYVIPDYFTNPVEGAYKMVFNSDEEAPSSGSGEYPMDRRIDQAWVLMEQGSIKEAVLEVLAALELVESEEVPLSRWEKAYQILARADQQIDLRNALGDDYTTEMFLKILEVAPERDAGSTRQTLAIIFKLYRQVAKELTGESQNPSRILRQRWFGGAPSAGLEEFEERLKALALLEQAV